MREEMQMATTLVIGGTGKTGRRVAQRLRSRGLPIRTGTPSSKPPFDWDDQATWAPALQDIESIDWVVEQRYRCTTGQVRVLVMPSTACTRATTSLPSSSRLRASARAITS